MDQPPILQEHRQHSWPYTPTARPDSIYRLQWKLAEFFKGVFKVTVLQDLVEVTWIFKGVFMILGMT